jgi:DNA-binding LacI/PurR family transcriptional regulator
MPATIKDIAQKLNLSISTVSYALNGGPKPVSKDVYRKVQRAAKEMGYRPNRLAKSLVTRRTHTIGVVPVDVDLDILLTPCVHLALNGVFNAAARLRQDVLIFTAHDRNLPDEVVEDMLDGRVDGVVFIVPRPDSPALHQISCSGLPFAIVGAQDERGASFLVDNERGSLMALEHLYDLGHRRIAHVVGNLGLYDGVVRRDAFRTFVASKALDMMPGDEIRGDYHRNSGADAGRTIAAMSDRPTAVFCANDDMAFGLIDSLQEAGLRVPRDISVVGFDDAPIASSFNPPLTTIRQPLQTMSGAALLSVVNQIEQGTSTPSRVFEPELVVRGSTAKPRSQQAG